MQFHTKTATITGDFDSSGINLSPEKLKKMEQDEKSVIDRYSNQAPVESFSYGKYPHIKVDITIAYRMAAEIARIMYSTAGVEVPESDFINGYPVAKVLNKTQHQCEIICPHCGRIHFHGIESIGGCVESHCLVKAPGDKGYFIKR